MCSPAVAGEAFADERLVHHAVDRIAVAGERDLPVGVDRQVRSRESGDSFRGLDIAGVAGTVERARAAAGSSPCARLIRAPVVASRSFDRALLAQAEIQQPETQNRGARVDRRRHDPARQFERDVRRFMRNFF